MNCAIILLLMKSIYRMSCDDCIRLSVSAECLVLTPRSTKTNNFNETSIRQCRRLRHTFFPDAFKHIS